MSIRNVCCLILASLASAIAASQSASGSFVESSTDRVEACSAAKAKGQKDLRFELRKTCSRASDSSSDGLIDFSYGTCECTSTPGGLAKCAVDVKAICQMSRGK